VATANDVYATSSHNKLYDFNAITGALKSVEPTAFFQELAVSNGSLFGIGDNTSTEQSYIASINPQTGAYNIIYSSSIISFVFKSFVGSNGNLYLLGSSSAGDGLYDFNANTGAIKSIEPTGSFQELAVSGTSLYGIGYNSSTHQNYIAEITPSTGAYTVLNSFALSTGSFVAGTFVGGNGNLHVLSGDDKLYDFDASTGAIKSIEPVGVSFESLAAANAH
jgi:hypothetical protein